MGKKFREKVPKLKWKYRVCLYLLAIFAGVFAVIGSQLVALPKWAGVVTHVVAFILVVISFLYLYLYFKNSVNLFTDRITRNHPFLDKVTHNYSDRTVVLAVPGMLLNIVFMVFNGYVGIRTLSAWYISLAVYYGLLGSMRFRFVGYEYFSRKGRYDQNKILDIFTQSGYLLIVMSLALFSMVVMIVHNGKGKSYPLYVTYVVGIYTLVKMIMASVNMVKARRLQSPAVMGIRNIGYADAMVSVLSTQTALFSAFGLIGSALVLRMNGVTGMLACAAVVVLGITMVTGAK